MSCHRSGWRAPSPDWRGGKGRISRSVRRHNVDFDAQFVLGKLNLSQALTAFSGIAFVGILNIATSFALSFVLAVRARNIGDEQSRHFMREVGRELISNPLAFLLPRP